MPIYEYECTECKHSFEVLVFAGDQINPQCPQCRSEHVKKMMSAAACRPHGIPAGSGGFPSPSCAPAVG